MNIKEDDQEINGPCSRVDSLRRTFARASEAKVGGSGETADTNYPGLFVQMNAQQ